MTDDTTYFTLRHIIDRMQMRVDAIEERDGKEGAVTGPGISISYLFAKDIVRVLEAAEKIELRNRKPEHWSVTVSRDGEQIVTIETNCLSGRETSNEDDNTIRTAAHHLLSFIGDPTWWNNSREDG